MTISAGQVARVAVTIDAPTNTIAQNVFHYQNAGTAVAEASFLTAFEAYHTLAYANILPDTSNQYQPSTIEGWKYNMVTHKWEGFGLINSTSPAGSSAIDALPHGASGVARFVTSVARRQGRTFIAGCTEGVVVNSLWHPGTVTNFGTYLSALVLGFTVTGQAQQMGTFNLDSTSIYYETFSPATGTVVVSNVPGYQRRRKPGVGV